MTPLFDKKKGLIELKLQGSAKRTVADHPEKEKRAQENVRQEQQQPDILSEEISHLLQSKLSKMGDKKLLPKSKSSKRKDNIDMKRKIRKLERKKALNELPRTRGFKICKFEALKKLACCAYPELNIAFELNFFSSCVEDSIEQLRKEEASDNETHHF